ncbi:tetratricopeptide repeat protein [Maribacter sp. 2308TA10-17]|uniref:tetratricopeptide repeat protein n=1 Tax=Maribacter sp. 2308TA10-17 TaxID=3386276 RepID=UPI0039BD2840
MRTTTSFFSVLFFLCFTISALSQENKVHDSLLNIYNEMPKDTNKVEMLYDLYESVLFNDTELSKSYAEKLLKAAREYGTPRQVGSAYYAKSYIQRTIGNKDSHNIYVAKAKEIFIEQNYLKGIIDTDKAMAIIYDEDGRDDLAIKLLLQNIEREKIIKDTALLANDYKHLAGIYSDKKDFKLALEYCTLALKFHENANDPLRYADALYQMGDIESGLGNRQNAINNYKQALDIYTEQNDKFYQSIVHADLGSTYLGLNNTTKAKEHFNIGLVLAREMNSPVSELRLLSSLGNIEVKAENYDKGISYYKSALLLAEKNERKSDHARILYEIAEAELLKNSLKSALEFANKGLRISKSIKESASVSVFYKLRSKIFENQNKLAMAMDDYKSYETIKDSLFTVEKSQQIEELRAIYDTEKKEQQIAQQETEITLLEEKEKVSRLQKIALGGGLSLSALALGFGFYGFRQRTKKNKLEKEKMDAELAFKKSELDFKKKELTTQALQLAKKNETLENLKQKANELKTSEVHNGYQQLITAINFDLQDDNNWENFARYFEEVHKDFNSNVAKKYPEVTPNELRLMALLKMNLSSKEIANILNISIPGIKKARQRLRKKMQLSSTDSLENAVLSI